MKKTMMALALVALVAGFAASPPGWAGQRAQVRMAPLGRVYPVPPLGRKQGWLTISNQDWKTYTLQQGGDDKLFLYREGTGGYGGVVIPSGTTVTIAVEKDNYDLYGNNPDRLKVRVREGRTTTLVLEPFGFVGNSGLVGVVNDGERVRRGTLFDTYTTTVVVPAPPPPPPTVIVQPPPPPPPPPVIIRPPVRRRPPPPPPPVVVVKPAPPPVIVRPAPPPPVVVVPPPPPPPPPKKDGFGFFFGFNSR